MSGAYLLDGITPLLAQAPPTLLSVDTSVSALTSEKRCLANRPANSDQASTNACIPYQTPFARLIDLCYTVTSCGVPDEPGSYQALVKVYVVVNHHTDEQFDILESWFSEEPFKQNTT